MNFLQYRQIPFHIQDLNSLTRLFNSTLLYTVELSHQKHKLKCHYSLPFITMHLFITVHLELFTTITAMHHQWHTHKIKTNHLSPSSISMKKPRKKVVNTINSDSTVTIGVFISFLLIPSPFLSQEND